VQCDSCPVPIVSQGVEFATDEENLAAWHQVCLSAGACGIAARAAPGLMNGLEGLFVH
jgi:hypothetical protein